MLSAAVLALSLSCCHLALSEPGRFPTGLPPQHITRPDADSEFRFYAVAPATSLRRNEDVAARPVEIAGPYPV